MTTLTRRALPSALNGTGLSINAGLGKRLVIDGHSHGTEDCQRDRQDLVAADRDASQRLRSPEPGENRPLKRATRPSASFAQLRAR